MVVLGRVAVSYERGTPVQALLPGCCPVMFLSLCSPSERVFADRRVPGLINEMAIDVTGLNLFA